MKDGVNPVPPEEVRGMIKASLETAAHVNYERLSTEAKVGEDLNEDSCVPPSKKLEDLIHLAELCVDLLQQNEEHYSEVLDMVFRTECSMFTGLSSERTACLFYVWTKVRVPKKPPQKAS